MLQKTFSSYFLLFALPILISFLSGVILIYINYRRSVSIQKKLKSNLLFQIENEKIKISRELHDTIGPFTLPLKEFIKRRGVFTDENEKEWLSEINKFESYLSKINESIFPAELLEGDFLEALQKLAKRLNTHGSKIAIHPEVFSALSKAHSIQIFRIIQESLINAVKYANSDFITIVIMEKGKDLICLLSYEIDGKMARVNSEGSLRRGHKIILQRLELLSGKYETGVEDSIKTEKFIFKDVFK